MYQWIASTSCNKVQAFCPTSTKKPSGKGTSSPVVAAKTSKEADSYTKDEINAMISRQTDEIAALNLEIDALKSCLNYEASSNSCKLSSSGDITLVAVGKVELLSSGEINLLSTKGISINSIAGDIDIAGDGCTGTCFPAH